MRVLIACEFSGVVRRAFRALGHDAWSCASGTRPQGPKLLGLYSEITGGWQERPSWAVAERGALPHWRGWATEPEVGRVANGVPDRSHRLRALGNAVVPQIPELLGHAILESMRVAA